MNTLITVVVSTYNRPDALKCCLDGLLSQSDKHFEIIVADDGSTSTTRLLIQEYITTSAIIPIKHVYQEDHGFRLSRIRNKAIIHCSGEYIIFIDGDCVTLPNFVQRHRLLADENRFVAGNRVLLNQEFTEEVLQKNISLFEKGFFYFLWMRLKKKINRFIPFIFLPLGYFRYAQPNKWQKAVGCNIAVWKKDLYSVNGYDESFEGWGYEDSDLVIRLIHQGIKRKEGRFSVQVLHLWHPQNNRSQHDQNYQRLRDRLSDKSLTQAIKGLAQHTADPNE